MKNKIKYALVLFSIVISALPFRLSFAKDYPVASDFKLYDLDKNQVALSEYKDKKPVLLLFWTTWCPFCRDQLLIFQEKREEFEENGIEILTINGGESTQKVKMFVKNNKITLKVLLDWNLNAARKLDIYGVPTYLLVNKAGRIVYKDNVFPEDYETLLE